MASDKINRETNRFVARFEEADATRRKYGIRQYSNSRRSLVNRRKTAKAHSIMRDRVLRLAEKGALRESPAPPKRRPPNSAPATEPEWKSRLRNYLKNNPSSSNGKK